jgi:hypothetical protein
VSPAEACTRARTASSTLFLIEIEKRQQPPSRGDPRLQLQYSHRWGKIEAAGTGSTGIHDGDDHIDQREQRSVGVAVHDDLSFGKRGIQRFRRRAAELVAVGDDDVEAIELQRSDPGKAAPELESVSVAVDRRYWRQCFEIGEYAGLSDIARVKNVVDLRERIEDLRAKKSMSVGDDPEPHQP